MAELSWKLVCAGSSHILCQDRPYVTPAADLSFICEAFCEKGNALCLHLQLAQLPAKCPLRGLCWSPGNW